MDAQQPPKRKKSGKILYTAILVILVLIFLFSAGSLLKYGIESLQSQQAYDELKDLRGEYTRPTIPASPTEGSGEATRGTEAESHLVTVTDPETGESRQVLSHLAELYQLNPDLAGWLTIPGTNVDYPVVHRPEDKDYYLSRGFDGKYSAHGCLYAQENCSVAGPSDNVTIYGHRMKDGSMLANLGKFESKEFWQDHQYLYFDTLTEFHTYQIIYVFTTTASVGEGFQYHLFVNAADEVSFNQFVTGCARNSLYDTGLTATYGDKLVTLSTCEYTHENGRLVVVAKRIN